MRRDPLTVALGTQLSAEVVKVGRALGVEIPDFFGIELCASSLLQPAAVCCLCFLT